MGVSASTGDDRVQRAVLALVLALELEELSIDGIVAEIGDRAGALTALDGLESVGLVQRVGDRVQPTAAARRFDELNI
jgi:hypothetical protein